MNFSCCTSQNLGGVKRTWAWQVFYAACQGLLYVLCYRLDSLMHSLPNCPDTSAADAMRHLFRETIPILLQSRQPPPCLPHLLHAVPHMLPEI
jgi:hypothetical protein